jgi:hypothetical protein
VLPDSLGGDTMRISFFALFLVMPVLAQASPQTADQPASAHWVDEMLAVFTHCATSTLHDRKELESVTGPTIINMRISKGSIADVSASASSGNPDLDARAIACVSNLPPELLKEIPDGQKFTFPLFWIASYLVTPGSPASHQ